MSEEYDIKEGQFFNILCKLLGRIIQDNKDDLKNGISIDAELEAKLPAKQKYHFGLFKRYSKIIRTIDQLDTIEKLIEIKPSIYLANEAKIEYSKYLEYNLENYLMRVVSILDQMIIFVSEFYNLGLPPQSTSLKMLRENQHTKDKKATKIIKLFDKATQHIRKLRNLIAHRGEFNDKDINRIEANLYFLSLAQDSKLDDPVIDRMYEDVDKLAIKKMKFVKSHNHSIKKYLYTLDQVLLEEYVLKTKNTPNK